LPLQFLGGCDATIAWIKANYMAGGAVSRAPRVVHSNDVDAPAGAGEAPVKYDYDLVVIGGGSGGLACSKEAAALGAKVAVLDFVKPSWQGTTWGLGGTCVNVGCIPKKLMHQAALLGEAITDARSYGWDVPAPAHAAHGVAAGAEAAKSVASHSWERMVSSVQDHIAGLNFGYRVQLREKGVKYENALGAFVDPHTLELTDKRGKTSRITTRRVVIAVGGRPKALDIPGGELAMSSDDLFSRATSPGKTLVVGASYVALECAGFLAGIGLPVTVMVRSILLRGFDQQVADLIGEATKAHGVDFVRPAVPTRIDKEADGRLKVSWVNSETGAEASEVYDSVFTATGREADTRKLNLEAAGVKVERDGKLAAVNEQTSVPHIYAIGDVLAGRPELTPVAIMAGRLLARRLFGGSTEGMDYDRIPTTVFTPLEYGCVGLSEEDALTRLGSGRVEVYHTNYTPLEWSVVESRPQNGCYAKLIVDKGDSNRVVGFHVLGPNAGEITQGWACALRLGATYESFTSTVGIHPTTSEEFTTLRCAHSWISGVRRGCGWRMLHLLLMHASHRTSPAAQSLSLTSRFLVHLSYTRDQCLSAAALPRAAAPPQRRRAAEAKPSGDEPERASGFSAATCSRTRRFILRCATR
jgi:thioredoxin reductase (NADPH)